MKATSQELQSTHVVIKNKALVYESYGSSKSVVPTRCDFFSPPSPGVALRSLLSITGIGWCYRWSLLPFIFQSALVQWKRISLTDAMLFI